MKNKAVVLISTSMSAIVSHENRGLFNSLGVMLNCKMREGPSEPAMQVEASTHRKLLWSKAMVVSVTEKGEARLRQVSANEDEHK